MLRLHRHTLSAFWVKFRVENILLCVKFGGPRHSFCAHWRISKASTYSVSVMCVRKKYKKIIASKIGEAFKKSV